MAADPLALGSLCALGDDCLRKALTFLTPPECARGPGAASKATRAVASSTSRARFTDEYVLRGEEHGVVHALATALGTRPWPTRVVQRYLGEPLTDTDVQVAALAPPPSLQIKVHRNHLEPDIHPPDDHPESYVNEPYASFFAAGVVDPDVSKEIEAGGECNVTDGSYVEYELPFQILVKSFRLGVSRCGKRRFDNWSFQAFCESDPESSKGYWRIHYYKLQSPWADEESDDEDHSPAGGRPILFPCFRDPLPASRFRIHMHGSEHMHMHLRGLELFGTILPPWRID